MKNKYHIKRIILSIFVLINISSVSYAQCPYEVKHNQGSRMISNTSVTVFKDGAYAYLTLPDTLCEGRKLYYVIGIDSLLDSYDGSYTFTFTPPVNSVTLSFYRLDNLLNSNLEEVQVSVNGQHYPIPIPGTVPDCPSDSNLAVLTSEGNVRASPDLNWGAWEGTVIDGPIDTITVLNRVITPPTAGASFTLFFCDSISVGHEELNLLKDISIYPNPFNEYLNVELPYAMKNVSAKLFNSTGQIVKVVDNIQYKTFTISRSDLPIGVYFLQVYLKDRVQFQGKVFILK